MSYFEKTDHDALLSLETGHSQDEASLQRVHTRMIQLHRLLHPRLKQHGFNLHADQGLSQRSGASPFLTPSLSLSYLRSPSDSENVERIIGLDPATTPKENKIYLNPTIELRITPEGFVIELIVAPEARYDQQNFVGKLSVRNHRMKFYKLLSDLEANYFLGFWVGVHVDNVHLETMNLPPQRILLEYLDTFAAGRDYLRIGRWYSVGDPTLGEGHLHEEAFQRVRELYGIYEFLLWTSDNNFHSFYKKTIARS